MLPNRGGSLPAKMACSDSMVIGLVLGISLPCHQFPQRLDADLMFARNNWWPNLKVKSLEKHHKSNASAYIIINLKLIQVANVGHSNFCDLINLMLHIWKLRRRRTTGSARPKLRSSAKFVTKNDGFVNNNVNAKCWARDFQFLCQILEMMKFIWTESTKSRFRTGRKYIQLQWPVKSFNCIKPMLVIETYSGHVWCTGCLESLHHTCHRRDAFTLHIIFSFETVIRRR